MTIVRHQLGHLFSEIVIHNNVVHLAGVIADVAHPVPWTQVCLTRRA